ncbi:Retaining alpha-galactosidase precursor [Sedimentisphaera cyanobacteriorum]|uniref:Probable pectate lyase C n=1 Tax=Sedimentisphaera cyanobacteriorum TaxID=1940790 RepID=A0A1Q2HRI2_9BACT|nr:glycoside hydrolase family 97 catalytic domain-containing protein [Sedimentisphaera cyanobacteriorum]AQQ10032.1 Retaining alpha-galactosidase precursor [Sedimentisphaera cyanobacteriorum]
MRFSVCLIVVIIAAAVNCFGAVNISGPSGAVSAEIGVGESGLYYSAEFNGITAVENSDMGIEIDGIDYSGQNTLKAEQIETYSIDQAYPFRGGKSVAHNFCSGIKIPLDNQTSGQRWIVEARAYDDGFAFRYIIPSSSVRTVNKETTSFKMPAESDVWFFERDSHWKLKTYAGEWMKADISQMPEISPEGPVQGALLLFELPSGGYAGLTEAGMMNYSGMRYEAVGNNTFQANFTEGVSGFSIDGDITSPWRVVLFANDLNELVNTAIPCNLSSEPELPLYSSTDYIQPGRSVWRWWSKDTGTPEQEKQMIDFAEQLGFEYTIIDAGWESWPEKWTELADICDYAEQKDVRVIVWKHSGEIDSPASSWTQMAGFLDNISDAGAEGVKIDYINAESKDKIDFEIAALKLAAERQLVVNFHGCSKAAGQSRTYPNELTREGIRGLELNKMGKPLPAGHNAALPFTRFVLGHADYTPFTLTADKLGNTTVAHQLAGVVCFTSPLQVIAEDPAKLLAAENAPVTDILKDIPTVWDETIVLDGSSIGELAVLARRKDHRWFVGGINGAGQRDYSCDLSFLSNGSWSAKLLRDTPGSQTETQIDISEVAKNDSINIPINEAGGFVLVLTKNWISANTWEDNSQDHKWSEASNWSTGSAPSTANSWIKIIGGSMAAPADYPQINSVVQEIKNLKIGSAGSGQAKLTINPGGGLSVEGIINLGDYNNPDVEGVLIINGGSLNAGTGAGSGQLRVGVRNTDGTIHLNEGKITAENLFIPYSTGSSGRIYLNGGTLEVENLYMRNNPDLNQQSLIDIAGGTLVLPGNRIQTVKQFTHRGGITAYSGRSTLQIDYGLRNLGKTTVTAEPFDPFLAHAPYPGHGTKEVSLNPVLSWVPAEDAVSQDIYFGTDYQQVLNASRLPADFDGNRTVDLDDLAFFMSQWLLGSDYQQIVLNTKYVPALSYSQASQLPYNGSPAELCSQIEIEDYDEGGAGVGYYDTSTGNSYGQYRSDDVDIAKISELENQYAVMGSASEWLEYTVESRAGVYDISVRAACAYAGRSITLKLNDSELAEINLPDTGGWDEWQMVTVENVEIAQSGAGVLRLELQGGLMGLDRLRFINTSKPADLNEDQSVNLLDAAILSNNWKRFGPSSFKGSQTENTFSPGSLDYGERYYWRVDAVTPAEIRKGDLWEFDTEIYVDTEKPGWKLTFHDEFNGADLDWQKWESESGSPGHIDSSRWPENAVVENGNLRLLTKKEQRGGKEWTSGHIWSRIFKQKYGYWEARYKIADSTGLNNAFWMIETGDFEIDIDEGHYPDQMHTNVHNWAGTHWGEGHLLETGLPLSEEYHTRALEWTPEELIWYFDGTEVRRWNYETKDISLDKPVAVRFSTAVVQWAGEVTDELDGTSMDIDYVRVYERSNEAFNPYPEDNAAGISTEVKLGWESGMQTAQTGGHHIYFGTSRDAVLNADTQSPEYAGCSDQPIFDPGSLSANTTYYWRIDQTDGEQVWKGFVWEFDTWQDAPEKIAPDSLEAFASGVSQYGEREPIYAVNGAGLTESGHTNQVNENMWMTDQQTGWFKIDLNNHFDLHLFEMKVWNFNMAGYTERGVKQADIYYSDSPSDPGSPAENPSAWNILAPAGSQQFPKASGEDDYDNPAVIEFPLNANARWIYFDINSNHNGDRYAGLSEIMFERPDSISVQQFGAYPDDSQDDAQALRSALSYARENNIRRIVFQPGQYDFRSKESRPGKGHANLFAMDLPGLIFEGAVNPDGSPAAKIVRHYEFSNDWYPTAIIHFEGCDGLQFRNLIFDNSPQYCTSGQVVEKTGDSVTVEIFEGLPYIDNTLCYCANAWDLETGRLKHVESLTYGGDVDKNKDELIWRKVHGGSGRRVRLESDYFTDKIEAGEGISWHFGWRGLQLKFIQCDDLYVENVKTLNAAGFAMISSNCEDIYAKDVQIRAEGGQLPVGPRDGWKLYACRGEVLIEDMYCEGVRWDGQNVHGSFCWVTEKLDAQTVKMTKKFSSAYPIHQGTKVILWDNSNPYELTVQTSSLQRLEDGSPEFTVSFSQDIPSFVNEGTIASIYSWNIDSYKLKNCDFAKIAGSAGIIRNDGAVFEGCSYDNIMYPALVLGANVNEGEGTFTKNVTIRNSAFSDSGWVDRQNAKGLIGIQTGGTSLCYMNNIQIIDSSFEQAEIGIDISGAEDVLIQGNTFQDIGQPWKIDDDSTSSIAFENNKIY